MSVRGIDAQPGTAGPQQPEGQAEHGSLAMPSTADVPAPADMQQHTMMPAGTDVISAAATQGHSSGPNSLPGSAVGPARVQTLSAPPVLTPAVPASQPALPFGPAGPLRPALPYPGFPLWHLAPASQRPALAPPAPGYFMGPPTLLAPPGPPPPS